MRYHRYSHVGRAIGKELTREVTAFKNARMMAPVSAPGRVIFNLDLKTGYFIPRNFNPGDLEERITYQEAISFVSTVDQAASWGTFKPSRPEKIFYNITFATIIFIFIVCGIMRIWEKSFNINFVRVVMYITFAVAALMIVSLVLASSLMVTRSCKLKGRENEFNQILRGARRSYREEVWGLAPARMGLGLSSDWSLYRGISSKVLLRLASTVG